MAELQPISRYQVTAKFSGASVAWEFAVETPSGPQCMTVADGSEIPILLELVRNDRTIYFDPVNRRLTTGWNAVGNGRL